MSTHPASTGARVSSGFAAPEFEPVRTILDQFLLQDESFSAQVSCFWQGDLVLDLVGGPDMTPDSITGTFSATKGVAALVFALLLQDHVVDLDETVAYYWPEFGAAGKDLITIRQMLSHQGGLPGLVGGFALSELHESSGLAASLAATHPSWRPGSCFGYHAATLGIFIEELVRRTTGQTIQRIYEDRIRAPRNIDFFLGLPSEQEHRYRDSIPAVVSSAEQCILDATEQDPDSFIGVALARTRTRGELLDDEVLLPNRREVRKAGAAAFGGVGTARGLAEVYNVAVFGNGEDEPLLNAETIVKMSEQQCWGLDRVLERTSAWAIVFEKSHRDLAFGSHASFGHSGANGAIGMADPLYGLAFAYIPQRMTSLGSIDHRPIRLSRAVRDTIANI